MVEDTKILVIDVYKRQVMDSEMKQQAGDKEEARGGPDWNKFMELMSSMKVDIKQTNEKIDSIKEDNKQTTEKLENKISIKQDKHYKDFRKK